MTLDLGGVHLVTTLRLCVPSFPLGPLLFEPFEPFVGLGIEALGEDVVPLLVVRVGHSVLRRIELFGVVLVGLLEGEGNTATLEVDVDDLDHDFFADVDDLIRNFHVAFCQLGDVDQTLDAFFNANERAERNQLGDLTGNNLANGVGAGEDSPRIFLGGLERQGDTLAIHVDIEDLDGDLVANSDNLGRVVDVLPGQLGDVNQTVYAAKIDECTEVDDRGNDALADLTLLELVQELGANLGLGLLEPCTTGEHNVVAVLVELDDLRFQLLADVRLKITHATHLNQGSGEEPTKTDIEN